MVLVSYSGKEINAKIVFYGPGLCGKTTNLEFIYGSIPSNSRGKMVSMKTKTERTLFFDFLPLNLGELAGFKTRFLLYTVPGQVYYNATRKLVLKGVDAIIFVADSQRGKMEENIDSFQNLRDNLKEHGLSLDEIPYVLQYNKRDLPGLHSVNELEKALNIDGVPSFEAVATTGVGVFETFKAVSKLLLAKLSKEIGTSVIGRDSAGGPAAAAAASVSTAEATPAPPPVAEVPAELALFGKEETALAQGTEMPQAESAQPEGQVEADEPRKSRGLWHWFRKGEAPAEPPAAAEPVQAVIEEAALAEPVPPPPRAVPALEPVQAVIEEAALAEPVPPPPAATAPEPVQAAIEEVAAVEAPPPPPAATAPEPVQAAIEEVAAVEPPPPPPAATAPEPVRAVIEEAAAVEPPPPPPAAPALEPVQAVIEEAAAVEPPPPPPAAPALEPVQAVIEEASAAEIQLTPAASAEGPAAASGPQPSCEPTAVTHHEGGFEQEAAGFEEEGQEIVVPVLLPRSVIEDRVVIRLELRVVQEHELPEGAKRSPHGGGESDLLASA